MQRIKTITAILLLITGIFGVGFFAWQMVFSERKPTLHIYNWSDYIDPELVAAFEEQEDCKVVIDTFDDNETLLAKLMAGAKGYDVIFPSSYVVPVLKRNNLIQRLDMEKLPNVKANFDDKYETVLHEDTFMFSIPYAFSITGIAYRNDKNIKEVPMSWDFLLSPSVQQKICILNDIREMLGIGLKRNGFSVNSLNEEHLTKATEYAKILKAAARRLDNSEYRVGLANGTFYAAIGYNSDVLQVKQENPDIAIEFFVPEEGSTCCWDEMCITTFSEQSDLAHKFIDFLYDARNAAQNIDYVCSIQPNKRMWEYLDEEKKSDPLVNLNSNILARVELIKDIGDNVVLYSKFWDEFLKTN